MDPYAFPPSRFHARRQTACDTLASDESTASQWAHSLTSKIEGVHIAPNLYRTSDSHPPAPNRLDRPQVRHPSVLIPGRRQLQTNLPTAIPHLSTSISDAGKELEMSEENLLANWPWHVEIILRESQHMSLAQYAQWIWEYYNVERLGTSKIMSPAQLAASRAIGRVEIAQNWSPQPNLKTWFARYDPTQVSFVDDRAHQIASAVYRAFQRVESSETPNVRESNMTKVHYIGVNGELKAPIEPRADTEQHDASSMRRDIRVRREPSIWNLLRLCFKKPEVVPALSPRLERTNFRQIHQNDRLQPHTTPEDLARLRALRRGYEEPA